MSAKYSFCRQNIGGGNACNELGVGEGFQTVDSNTPWLATFRGRFGVAWQSGVNSETPIFASSTSTTTKTGRVAGLGAELMLARNWAARAEWLYVDLGTVTDTLWASPSWACSAFKRQAGHAPKPSTNFGSA
jgi:outer membrane immunogenic protein